MTAHDVRIFSRTGTMGFGLSSSAFGPIRIIGRPILLFILVTCFSALFSRSYCSTTTLASLNLAKKSWIKAEAANLPKPATPIVILIHSSSASTSWLHRA